MTLGGFSNEHEIVCVDYISEVLADGSVKNSKKIRSCEAHTKKKPTKGP